MSISGGRRKLTRYRRGLWEGAVRVKKKGGYQCMGIGDDVREKIFKNVWTLSWEEKRTFVTSPIEMDDVARRMVLHASESGVLFDWFLNVLVNN